MQETDDHTLLVRLDEKVTNLIAGFDEFRREKIKSLEDRLAQAERRIWMFSGGLIVVNVVIAFSGRILTLLAH
jgi:hypothetical protein